MAADYGHKNVLVCFWWDAFTYKLVMKAGSEAFAAHYKQVSTKGVLFKKYIFFWTVQRKHKPSVSKSYALI